MKTFFKNLLLLIVVAVISICATLMTIKYINSSSEDVANGSTIFGQVPMKLGSHSSNESVPDFTTTVENTVNGVVHIKSMSKNTQQRGQRYMSPWDYFFGAPQDQYGSQDSNKSRVTGAGSGVIISEDGYIITNNHVIDKATEVEVILNDNSKYDAKIIGTDPQTDIALLKIESEKKFTYIPFGDSDKLKVGEWVLAIGNPFNLTSTVTKGIVSAKARGNIGGGAQSVQSFIQTDAAINPGNSGGALVNINGELIGINTAIYSQTGSFAGYGFAVPISIAGKVTADIKQFGAVQRAMLGIQIIDLATMREIDELKSKTDKIELTEGVYIDGFAEKSPAQKAGMELGDVIVSVNGVKTLSSSVLQEQVSKLRPGDKAKISISRSNKLIDFEVVLTNSDGNTEIVKADDPIASAGVTFKELNNEKKRSLGISYGVEIAEVEKNGAFASRGLKQGYIILEFDRRPVASVDQANSIIKSKSSKGQDNDNVLLVKYINPSGKIGFDAIVLNE